MRLIAHRGNIKGPRTVENHPCLVEETLKDGFDAEIDVWLIEETFFLGHDKPEHKINIGFLDRHCEKLWLHVKNFEALNKLISNDNFNLFWHEFDRFTLTSKGIIWTLQNEIKVGNSSVLVDLEANTKPNFKSYGICSDYVEMIKNETH